MAKFRYVNTRFWDDAYVTTLDPHEKLLFLYLLTNPLTLISGVYEIETRRMAFDTGIDQQEIGDILDRFEAEGKIIYEKPWLAIVNFLRHQSLNPKVCRGVAVALQDAPMSIMSQLEMPTRIGLLLKWGEQRWPPAASHPSGRSALEKTVRKMPSKI